MIKMTLLLCILMANLNASELIIMTHNLAMKNDRKLFSSMAASLKDMDLLPDIIFLQEAVATTSEILREEFQMNGHFSPRPGDNEAIGILSKFPIIYRESLTLTSRKNGFTRVAAMVEVEHPKLGMIRLVSVHLAYRFEESSVRLEQIKEVMNWMKKREKRVAIPYKIIGGDFNAISSESLFDELKTYVNPNTNIETHFPSNRRIDYIFFKGFRKRASITEKFPFPKGYVYEAELSDHKSLLFEVKALKN